MSSMPYNSKAYLDAKVSMKDHGTVDAGRQIQSPASAGSRGLAKTMTFSKDKTQMQLGQEAIAESMVDIRSIMNRIDGVNVPTNEMNELADDDKMEFTKVLLDMSVIKDRVQALSVDEDAKASAIQSLTSAEEALVALDETAVKEDAGDIKQQLGPVAKEVEMFRAKQKELFTTIVDALSQDGTGLNPTPEAEKLAMKMLSFNPKDVDHYSPFNKESAVKEDAGEDEKVVDMLRKIKQHLDNHPNMNEHPSLVALDQLADDLESGDKPADYESAVQEDSGELSRLKELSGMEAPKESEETVSEDIDERGRIALEKAGFDPMKVKEYMAVFNDHGDTSDIDQMNMDKVGLADAMAMVLASHDVENESYQPFPEGDEFNIEEDEDFEEVLGPLGFPEDETELFDAEYQGRKVPLNKPMRGDVKKFKVYVKDPKTGNVKKVNFGHGGTSAKKAGQKTMKIRKSNPKARKSFRARHNCANPGPKTKARFWSCRKW